MTNPRLSIITPCLNQAELLKGCLRHVAALGPDIEHIVVDGASCDGTVKLLQAAQQADPQRLRFVSKPDRNLYEAVNTGLALAQAEVCTYLNCDDLLLPWAVDSMLQVFDRQPHLELLVGDAIEWQPSQGRAALIVHPPAPLLRSYLRADGHLAQPAVFFRASLLQGLGGFATGYRLLGDHELWLRALKNGAQVQRLWELVAVQRMSPDQLMAQHAALAVDERARIRQQHGIGASSRQTRFASQLGFALLHRVAMLTTWTTSQVTRANRVRALPWSRAATSGGLLFESLPQLLRAVLGSSAQRRYLALDLAALGLDDLVERPQN